MTFLAKARATPSVALCDQCGDKKYVTREERGRAVARTCDKCMAVCEHCSGHGYLMKKDWTGQFVTERCVCLKRAQRIQRFNEAKVPPRYADASIGDEWNTRGWHPETNHPRQQELRRAIVECLATSTTGAHGIGVSGPVGVGKTHLMCGIIRYVTLQQGRVARFVEFKDLIRDIKSGYDRGEGESQTMIAVRNVDVLVIDDLAKEVESDWQANLLDELISHRYNHALTTFFSTNFPFDGARGLASRDTNEFKRMTLRAKIGDRLYSRLNALCSLWQIEGSDHRIARR